MKADLAGKIAAFVFVYLVLFQFRSFTAFWTPILAPVDHPNQIYTLVAIILSMMGIAVVSGESVYRLLGGRRKRKRKRS
jgi:hypothetical protein